jgi:hypothetical protein
MRIPVNFYHQFRLAAQEVNNQIPYHGLTAKFITTQLAISQAHPQVRLGWCLIYPQFSGARKYERIRFWMQLQCWILHMFIRERIILL